MITILLAVDDTRGMIAASQLTMIIGRHTFLVSEPRSHKRAIRDPSTSPERRLQPEQPRSRGLAPGHHTEKKRASFGMKSVGANQVLDRDLPPSHAEVEIGGYSSGSPRSMTVHRLRCPRRNRWTDLGGRGHSTADGRNVRATVSGTSIRRIESQLERSLRNRHGSMPSSTCWPTRVGVGLSLFACDDHYCLPDIYE